MRWIDNYILRNEPFPRLNNPIGDLYADPEVLEPEQHPFPAKYVRRMTTMLVEPNVFLRAVTSDFLMRGGRIVVREFRDVKQVMSLEDPVIMNCTGLGSRDLFGDPELTPMKGQLAILLPQPEVDYVLLAGESYMFPRRDGIVLGGTRERDVWSTETQPETIGRIVNAHRAIFEAMER